MSSFLSNILRRLGVLAGAVMLFGACITCHNVAGPPILAPKVHAKTVIHGDVMIDPAFSGPERKLVLQALGEWESATNGAIKLDISDNPSREFKEVQQIRYAQAIADRKKAQAAAADAGADAAAPDDDDDEMTEDDIDDGPDGVAEPTSDFWNTELGCTDKMAIIRGTSSSPVIQHAEIGMGLLPGVSSSGLLGLSHPFCRFKYLVLVSDRLRTTRDFRETIVHELGHMFGMQHSFVKGSGVMYAETEQTLCVTEYDTNNFVKRWHLDASAMMPHVCPYTKPNAAEDL